MNVYDVYVIGAYFTIIPQEWPEENLEKEQDK